MHVFTYFLLNWNKFIIVYQRKQDVDIGVRGQDPETTIGDSNNQENCCCFCFVSVLMFNRAGKTPDPDPDPPILRKSNEKI